MNLAVQGTGMNPLFGSGFPLKNIILTKVKAFSSGIQTLVFKAAKAMFSSIRASKRYTKRKMSKPEKELVIAIIAKLHFKEI